MTNVEIRKLPHNQPEDYATLDPAIQARLQAWIADHITPARRTALDSSYTLKHAFEAVPAGVYVTNGQFKGAMRAAGFEPVDATKINWKYRIRYRR